MIKPIVTNEERLSVISIRIDPLREPGNDAFVSDVVKNLLDTANHHAKCGINGCLGLAANQIGYLVRIIAISFNGEFMAMVNPVIAKKRGGKAVSRELCLSRPGIKKPVKKSRHKRITVKFIDPNTGNPVSRKFSCLDAYVVQHEVDHLDGIYI